MDLTASFSSPSRMVSCDLWNPYFCDDNIKAKISSCIRKWLPLHNTTTNISLYSSSLPCLLPFKSLSWILKPGKFSGQLLLRGCADPCVSEAKVLLKSGNWLVSEVVEEVERRLCFKQSLGYHQSHRADFRSVSITEVTPKHSYACKKLLASMCKASGQNGAVMSVWIFRGRPY